MNAPRLSIIPARAATDASLKPRDLQVLCVLGRHTDDYGWCRRSQVKMANEMGCARSTVQLAVDRLIKAGYLERHVQEAKNGRDSAHLFRVVLDPVHPDMGAIQETNIDQNTGADNEHASSELACLSVGTPADPRSAPPADSGSAPPADSGSAPRLTTPLNDPTKREREGAGECRRGKKQTRTDKLSVVRDFWTAMSVV